MANINPIDPLRNISGIGSSAKLKPAATGLKGEATFKQAMSNFLNEVNTMQVKADESIQKMAAGEITDVHQVMNSVQEANVAFNLMMEIRNKVVDAYKEVIRMRI
jgi:flagellar hook-basal body complex protein FliE